MTVRNITIILSTSCFLGASGCSNNASYEEIGELAGYAAGAAVGLAIGDDLGIGDLAGSFFGGIAGSMAGAMIGAKLDEVDQLKAEIATIKALEISEPATVKWQSDENKDVSGVVTTKPTRIASNSECRQVSHIVNVRGKEYKESDTVCRQSDGSWAIS